MSKNAVYDHVPQLKRLRDDVLFGDVWQQPELTPRDRSLITCAVLATLGKEAELNIHMQRGIENGLTPDELRGLIVHIAFYAGWPNALGAGRAAAAIFEKAENDAQTPG